MRVSIAQAQRALHQQGTVLSKYNTRAHPTFQPSSIAAILCADDVYIGFVRQLIVIVQHAEYVYENSIGYQFFDTVVRERALLYHRQIPICLCIVRAEPILVSRLQVALFRSRIYQQFSSSA